MKLKRDIPALVLTAVVTFVLGMGSGICISLAAKPAEFEQAATNANLSEAAKYFVPPIQKQTEPKAIHDLSQPIPPGGYDPCDRSDKLCAVVFTRDPSATMAGLVKSQVLRMTKGNYRLEVRVVEELLGGEFDSSEQRGVSAPIPRM